jgi:DNA-binding phage protein
MKLDLAKAQKLADEGRTLTQTAEAMGCTRAALYKNVRKGLLKFRFLGCRHNAVMPIESLRQMIEAGRTTRQIAEAFGVNMNSVTRRCHKAGIPLPTTAVGRPKVATKTARKPKAAVPVAVELPPPPPPARNVVRFTAKPSFVPPVRRQAPEPDPKHQNPPRLSQLIATGGRYADLAEWAKRWGVGMARAQQEWHGLRLPLVKGGRV